MHHKLIQSFVLFFCLIGSAVSLAEPVKVFVSIIPQKTFVEEIGGEQVVVEAMVQAGASPALYEPTPKQMQRLSQADIYITTGVPFESAWMKAIVSANPEMTVIDGLRGIDLLSLAAHHHHEAEEEHDHGAEEDKDEHDHESAEGKEEYHDVHENDLDPHVWTSPVLVQRMIATIRDALIAVDEANAGLYSSRYTAYKAKLSKLDGDIRSALAGVKHKKFVTFHPTWGYFAATYGLTQVAIEQQGKEPSTQAIEQLIEEAKEENVRAVFVQPQFSKKLARVIAQAVQAEVIEVDALSANYDESMRDLVANLQRALL